MTNEDMLSVLANAGQGNKTMLVWFCIAFMFSIAAVFWGWYSLQYFRLWRRAAATVNWKPVSARLKSMSYPPVSEDVGEQFQVACEYEYQLNESAFTSRQPYIGFEIAYLSFQEYAYFAKLESDTDVVAYVNDVAPNEAVLMNGMVENVRARLLYGGFTFISAVLLVMAILANISAELFFVLI